MNVTTICGGYILAFKNAEDLELQIQRLKQLQVETVTGTMEFPVFHASFPDTCTEEDKQKIRVMGSAICIAMRNGGNNDASTVYLY